MAQDSQTKNSAGVAKAWFLLFRPWSYTATLVPFLLAAGVVSFCGAATVQWERWSVGLLAGLFFQATVNLLNTWGDERSGVDSVPGAIRTTPQVHQGFVSMKALLRVALLCSFAASVLGVGLCFYRREGGWLIDWTLLGAGFVGFLGSLNYSTGIKFKYHGLGVPFVSFLMGPLEIFVACLLLLPPSARGADVLLSPHVVWGFTLLSLPIAALVGVIMHGNDMRDIPTDRAAGIVTLASWLGPRRALTYYRTCHILPYVFCVVFTALAILRSVMSGHGVSVAAFAFLLPFLCLPLSLKTLGIAGRVYREAPDNPPWRGLERGSGGILFVFGIFYSLAFAFA